MNTRPRQYAVPRQLRAQSVSRALAFARTRMRKIMRSCARTRERPHSRNRSPIHVIIARSLKQRNMPIFTITAISNSKMPSLAQPNLTQSSLA